VTAPVEILLATGNPDKGAEMARLLGGLPLTLRTRADFPDLPEVVEDADSFAGNAIKKAAELSAATGLLALGDDSGLCVDALDGAPGIYSARYAGEDCSYADNNAKLVAALKDTPEADRSAHFVCVVAIVGPGLEPITFEGRCDGLITEAPEGAAGFGYDPIFLIPENGRTFGQMTADEKARISHRARAFAQARAWLSKHLDTGS
jgi:XTP/dITP diphosphohydrolase